MLDPSGSSVQVTHNLSNHLSDLGCEVEVFTAPHWLRACEVGATRAYRTRIMFYRGTQFRCYETRTMASKFLFWRAIRLVQHAWATIRLCFIARGFDVVHTQILPVPLLDYLCLRVIARHTPVVCTVHELVPHSSRLRKITKLIFRAIYRQASVLFVYTDYTRNRLISQFGIAPDRLVRVPHGSLEHMPALVADLPPVPPAQAPVILFIGSIRPDKGVDILIKAAWHLRKRISHFKVYIAGPTRLDVTLFQKLVAEFGLQDCVELHAGYLPEREFAEHLSRATVVALPYKRVEQSGVAIAACTLGKAIVATRCGGVEELITEAGNGLLVPVDDPAALAEALAVVLLDDGKRRQFEIRSKRYADDVLSWGPITTTTLAGYKAAMEHHERRMHFSCPGAGATRPVHLPPRDGSSTEGAALK